MATLALKRYLTALTMVGLCGGASAAGVVDDLAAEASTATSSRPPDSSSSAQRGTSGGLFMPPVYRTGAGPNAVIRGDVDGDGWADLMTANSATISVLRGLQGGIYTQQIEYQLRVEENRLQRAM